MPAQLPSDLHSVTRHLYQGNRVGRVTCFWQEHGVREAERLEVIPGRYRVSNYREQRLVEATWAWGLVLAGALEFRMDGRCFAVTSGMCFQINGIAFQNWQVTASAGTREVGLNLDGITGARLCDIGLWEDAWIQGHCQDLATAEQAVLALRDVCRDVQRDASAVLRATVITLDQLYDICQPLTTHADDFAARACRLLRSHPEPDFDMQRAASALGLSYDLFRRRFRAAVGEPPARWQRRYRMQLAQRLLQAHSVEETAQLLGYSDAFVFSRQFRREMGQPPSRYQASVDAGL